MATEADLWREAQRAIVAAVGIDLSPELERALWPTEQRPQEKLVTGGIQAGKSTEGALEVWTELPMVLDRATVSHPKRYWYIVPNYNTPLTEYEYLIQWCDSYYGADSYKAHMATGDSCMLTIYDRVIIETRTSQRPEGIAARAVDGIVVVEAGQQPEAVRTAALERTVTLGGWVTYTGTLEDDEAKPRYAWYDVLAQKWRDDWTEGVAVSLPTWANRAKFPGGRDHPYIKDREARLDEHTFKRRFAGVPSGVQYPVYPQLLVGDDWGFEVEGARWILSLGAGGYDYGTTPGHPSTLVVGTVTPDDVVVLRDAWEADPGGDTRRNDLQRDTFSHQYGILRSRWGFDPMLRESADRVGAMAMIEGNTRRLTRVGRVEARFNDGRLLFDLSNPMVRKVFEQMKRVHYQKRTSPEKGEYYEYHRSDDDFAAAVENLITVIDSTPEPLPTRASWGDPREQAGPRDQWRSRRQGPRTEFQKV